MKQPPKKIIAVDIDEVLANFVDYFIEFHNLEYQTTITKDHVITFELNEIFQTTPDEMNIKFDKFKEQGHNLKLKPIKGSQEAIDGLIKRGYELHIITSRPDMIKKDTEKWIDTHFPNKFFKVHYSYNKYVRYSFKNMTKGQICKSIGARVLIEDNLEMCLDANRYGITVLLLDAPWNQMDNLPKGIFRVRSWKQILDIIDKVWE